MNSIFNRVSVRKYLDTPVEVEKIEKILRAAMCAPSGGNQQPWKFLVVQRRDIIEKLGRSSPYAVCASGAPVVIVPCIDRTAARFPELVEMDLSNATENMLLEITELGLGGVWLAVTPYEDRLQRVHEALGIGPEDGLQAFALVSLGYPAATHPQQDRYDESRIVYFD